VWGLSHSLSVICDGYKTPLPGLGFVRGHRDKAPAQVDLAPVQPLQFGHPQTGKGSKGQEGL